MLAPVVLLTACAATKSAPETVVVPAPPPTLLERVPAQASRHHRRATSSSERSFDSNARTLNRIEQMREELDDLQLKVQSLIKQPQSDDREGDPR